MAMREVIPTMNLLKEISVVIGFEYQKPTVKSKAFSIEFPKADCIFYEDNQSCIALAKCPKMNPRTKHIALKYHHFRKYVEEKIIGISYIETNEQVSDALTKPLPDVTFLKHRRKLCGYLMNIHTRGSETKNECANINSRVNARILIRA